jgi:hypothetical protein
MEFVLAETAGQVLAAALDDNVASARPRPVSERAAAKGA